MVTDAITGIGSTQIAAELLHGQQRGFEASGIETGLDQQEIGAAFHQPLGLFVIGVVAISER